MTNKDNFEKWRFRTSINVITKENYPITYPMHWHKHMELIIYPKAEELTNQEHQTASIQIGQDTYNLTPGDILVVWQGELHEVIDNQVKELISLQFPLAVISEIRDFALSMNTLRQYHLLKISEHPELLETMLFEVQQIYDLKYSKEPFSEVEMVIHLFQMFMAWGRFEKTKKDIGVGFESEVKSKQTIEKFELACAYIHENCDSNITLESVADYIGFSPCYFSRYFKKVTTHKFVDYLTHQRIKLAQTLLTDSDLPITDVAFQSGFKSISTFNRVFLQYNGCSPSQYKRYYDDTPIQKQHKPEEISYETN